MLDVDTIRKETPGLQGQYYFDNAGASLPHKSVNETIKAHLDLEAEVGGYVSQEQKAAELEDVYTKLATLLGGKAQNYALTNSAVDSWNSLFQSVPLTAHDNIIVAFNEYCSNYLAILHRAKQVGFEVRVAEPDSTGALDLDGLNALIDERTKLITACGISSSSGQILDMAGIGKIAKAHNVLYLLDACQAVGQVEVNVEAIQCDMLTGTSRKYLRGPRGVGFLYVSDTAIKRLVPYTLTNMSAVWTGRITMDIRKDARVFEAWERSVALQLGFGAALDYLLSLGVGAAIKRCTTLAEDLRALLRAADGFTVQDQQGPCGAIVTFTKENESPLGIKERLAKNAIAVQIASVTHTRLDLEARGLNSLVRVSPHYYNTHAELEVLVQALKA